MEKQDVVYISVNNWFCGRDYPPTENFKKWLGNDFNQSFKDDNWCKENKLCVYYGTVDMSTNYTISAPRECVEKNCPELLTDDEYAYITRHGSFKRNGLFGKRKLVWEDVEEKRKYSDFVYTPEEGEEYPGNSRIGDMPFRDYCEENFGSKYYETNWWGDDENEDDEDETEEIDEDLNG